MMHQLTKEEHFIGKVAQKAIIRKGDKVLLARDVHDQYTWELPGGRLNVGELPTDGLTREVNEELGVDIVVGSLVYSEQCMHQRDQTNALLLVYEVALVDPNQPFVLAPDEVAEVRWISPQELANVQLYDDMYRSLEYYTTHMMSQEENISRL